MIGLCVSSDLLVRETHSNFVHKSRVVNYPSTEVKYYG